MKPEADKYEIFIELVRTFSIVQDIQTDRFISGDVVLEALQLSYLLQDYKKDEMGTIAKEFVLWAYELGKKPSWVVE